MESLPPAEYSAEISLGERSERLAGSSARRLSAISRVTATEAALPSPLMVGMRDDLEPFGAMVVSKGR